LEGLRKKLKITDDDCFYDKSEKMIDIQEEANIDLAQMLIESSNGYTLLYNSRMEKICLQCITCKKTIQVPLNKNVSTFSQLRKVCKLSKGAQFLYQDEIAVEFGDEANTNVNEGVVKSTEGNRIQIDCCSA